MNIPSSYGDKPDCHLACAFIAIFEYAITSFLWLFDEPVAHLPVPLAGRERQPHRCRCVVGTWATRFLADLVAQLLAAYGCPMATWALRAGGRLRSRAVAPR